MNDPLVSIVVPSFKQGAFIGTTISSILDQDYRNLECIVYDAGSTDETLDVLRSYNDPRLIWTSEPDKGQSDAINKGMRRAQGSILSYLNSDDVLTPGAVRFTVDYLKAHPKVDLLFGDCDLINETGAWIGASPGEPFHLAEMLIGNHSIRQPGTFWKREVYEGIGDFDVAMHYSMDTDYWLRAVLAGFTLDYTPGVRAQFRLHTQSKSVSMQPKFLTDWRLMMSKVYAMPNLAPEIRALQAESDAFADWGWAKTYWLGHDYTQARPLLKKFIAGGKWSRRLIASTMYIDSYLHTPMTRLTAFVFARATGREILFSEKRAI
ncbi:MAG: glycosyltransferase family 2 protein [Chloroflexota bacterium]